MAEAKHFWICSCCKHHNDRSGGNEKCNRCENRRIYTDVKIQFSKRTVSGWTCRNCNCDNIDWGKCKLCSTSYNPYDTLVHKWICRNCNHKNDETSQICVNCKETKPMFEGFTPAISHQPITEKAHEKVDGDTVKPKECDCSTHKGEMCSFCHPVSDAQKSQKVYCQVNKKLIRQPSCGQVVEEMNKCDCIHKKGEKCVVCNPLRKPGVCKCLKNKGESCYVCEIPKVTVESVSRPPSRRQRKNDAAPFWKCKMCSYHNAMACEMCDQCKLDKCDDLSEDKRQSEQLKLQFSSSMIENSFRQDQDAAQKHLINIEQFCAQKDCKFKDNDFYPDSKHIGNEKFTRTYTDKGIHIDWKRCGDLHFDTHVEDREVVFKPCFADIKQGGLKNCWLLSALTVLSERDYLLGKIILSKSLSDRGVYLVRLCKDGRWKTVIVDDYFPCDTENKLIFSKVDSKAHLWVPLVVKAAAKLHGCYAALEYGSTLEALAMLTGQPCDFLDLRLQNQELNKDRVWAYLKNVADLGYIMGASTPDSEDERLKAMYEEKGLVIKHAYAILDVRDEGSNERLLRLRNPWGNDRSWNGDWSDTSEKWSQISEAGKSNLSLTGNELGKFWMCLDDFCRYFVGVEVCKAKKNWNEVRLKGTFPRNTNGKWKFVTLVVNGDDVEIEIGLFQKNLRGCDVSDTREPLLDLQLVVLENDMSITATSPFTKVKKASFREDRSFVGCSVTLGKGKYTIASLSFKNWDTASPVDHEQLFSSVNYSRDEKFALVIHSSKIVNTSEVNTDQEFYRYALADVIISLAVQEGRKYQVHKDVVLYELRSEEFWMGGFVVAENMNLIKHAKVEMLVTNSAYVVSTRDTRVDYVPPRHRQVLLVQTIYSHRDGQVGELKANVTMCDEQNEDDNHIQAIHSSISGLHHPRPFQGQS